MTTDRDDDELSWWDDLRTRDDEEILPPPPPDDSFNALERVRSLFEQPLLGESAPAPAPTLRDAASEKFRSAGLFGSPTPPFPASTPGSPASDEYEQPPPPSWKLPVRGTMPTILGDDTAAGPVQGARPDLGPMPSASDLPGIAAPSAAPRDPAAPTAVSPLDHPDAQTGLALTAADALLRKGIDLAVNLAHGNPALARTLVETAASAIAGILPAEVRASALTSADTAATEAERRVADNDRATRTRAAIGTLANRRTEAEHDHTAAVIAGDRAKIEEARRDAIEAWSAERRARGDSEAEINAGARALERDYRGTALRHRLAQLDEPALKRALDADEDAKSDPTLAREVAEDILRVRRDDPARVAEASIEREIAERKRDGRIDTHEEETRERYKLRLDAQAQRAIPEGERRILTSAERTAIALEYHRIEASQGKPAADKWLDERRQQAGPHGERLRAELTAQQPASMSDELPKRRQRQYAELPNTDSDASPPSDGNEGNAEPAQDQRRSPPTDAASRKVRAERVLDRYKAYLDKNRKDPQAIRDAEMERFSIEEGELPPDVARYFASRLRQPRDEKDMGTFISEARRIVLLADALPHSVGPEGIPKETLRVARKIVEAADNDPAEAEHNPRKVILDGIRIAGEEAVDEGEVIDPMIPFAVGMTIDPLRRRGLNMPRRERTWTPEQRDAARKQLKINKPAGDRAETQIREIILRDVEAMNISPQAKRLVRVEGRRGVIPDLPMGTKHDQIPVFVEAKKFGARHRDPQRRRLRKIGAHYVEINPDTGESRAQVPPYEKWITYEEWLRFLESELARRSRP